MTNCKAKLGLGVAGNFAQHLEQAGELEDFTHVKTVSEDAPKGVFPFYVENAEGALSTCPLSHETIVLHPDENVQAEPEVALKCKVDYQDGRVSQLIPTHFAPFNDCSIRKKGAKKISEKKNWGENTKGVGRRWIAIDHFETGGIMDEWHICSFVRRDGQLHRYGEDAAMVTYSFFHRRLIDWIVVQMNTQEDTGPLESIAGYVKQTGYPDELVVSIGATRYTEYGETTMLQADDEVSVVLYDARRFDPETVMQCVDAGTFDVEGMSALVQKAEYSQ